MTDLRRDVEAVVVEALEVRVLEVLRDLALAQLVLAAGLGDVRQVRELGQRVTQSLEDEDLPRGIREVLDRPDHVRDAEVVIVDRARQVIEAGAVRALHDVVLLIGPVERDVAPHEVVKAALTFARHLEPHDSLAPFGFEPLRVRVGDGHPRAAVEKRALVLLGGGALGLDLLGRRVVAIRMARCEQTRDGGPVRLVPLRLEVRGMRSAHLGPLVPIDAEPAETIEDGLQRLRDVALLVGVVDAQ